MWADRKIMIKIASPSKLSHDDNSNYVKIFFSLPWLLKAGKRRTWRGDMRRESDVDMCGGVKEEVWTDKINYATLDLAFVIPFSIGLIRILLIRFCFSFPTLGSPFSSFFLYCCWGSSFVPAFNEKDFHKFSACFHYEIHTEFKIRFRLKCEKKGSHIFFIPHPRTLFFLSSFLSSLARRIGTVHLNKTKKKANEELFNLIWNLYHALGFSLSLSLFGIKHFNCTLPIKNSHLEQTSMNRPFTQTPRFCSSSIWLFSAELLHCLVNIFFAFVCHNHHCQIMMIINIILLSIFLSFLLLPPPQLASKIIFAKAIMKALIVRIVRVFLAFLDLFMTLLL